MPRWDPAKSPNCANLSKIFSSVNSFSLKKRSRPQTAPFFILSKKTLQNLLLCLLSGQTQSHKLKNLLPGNLSNGSLMDQACIHVIGADFRNGAHLGVVHDNGITLHMTKALSISLHSWIEHLCRIILCHGAGGYLTFGVHSIQEHIHLRIRRLISMGQQLLLNLQLCAVAHLALCIALRAVHAANLAHIQKYRRPLANIENGLRI